MVEPVNNTQKPAPQATAQPQPTVKPVNNTEPVAQAQPQATVRPEPIAAVSEPKSTGAQPINTAVVNEAPARENTAEVNEAPRTAEVNEKPNFDSLSVDEQADYLSILQEKDKRGILSLDEKAILNKQKDLSDNPKQDQKKVAKAGAKSDDEVNDPDPEKKGPFKEEDIIKYMYNDWLLGGANWLWTKTAAKLDKGFHWSMRKMNERRRQRQIERGKTYDTETFYNKVADTAVASGQSSAESIEKHREEQLKNLELMKAGKMDEAKVSDATKVLFDNMDEKEKKQFFAIAAQGINNFYDNIAIAEQFSSNYAQAGMAFDLAQNKDFYAGKDLAKEFAAQKEKAMVLFARRLDQEQAKGGNPVKLAGNLLETSQDALMAAEKTMDKGKFAEKGNEPRTDLATKVNKISNELKSVAKPEDGQLRGLFEAAIADKNFDKGVEQTMGNINNAVAANLFKQDENNNRRDRVSLLKQKLGLTDENVDAFTKQYQNTQKQINQTERNQNMANSLSGTAALGRFGAGGR